MGGDALKRAPTSECVPRENISCPLSEGDSELVRACADAHAVKAAVDEEE